MRTKRTAKPRKQVYYNDTILKIKKNFKFSPGQDKNAIKKKALLVIGGGGRQIIWAKENPGEYLLVRIKKINFI